MVEYVYDSWGKLLSVTGTLASTLGQNQPFRYRGYVYDNETGWYYLQSRYYDPTTGRFISADVYLSTGQGVLGHNAFAYCLNNPGNMSDPSGARANVGAMDVGDRPFMYEGGGIPYIPIEEIQIIIDWFTYYWLALLGLKTISNADVKQSSSSEPIFYGAEIWHDELTKITGPMNVTEAVDWVIEAASTRKLLNSPVGDNLGTGRAWGLLTEREYDAFSMAWILGGSWPVGPEVGKGHGFYYHYHVFGRDFLGLYKSFHVWFGQPMP